MIDAEFNKVELRGDSRYLAWLLIRSCDLVMGLLPGGMLICISSDDPDNSESGKKYRDIIASLIDNSPHTIIPVDNQMMASLKVLMISTADESLIDPNTNSLRHLSEGETVRLTRAFNYALNNLMSSTEKEKEEEEDENGNGGGPVRPPEEVN